MFKIWLSKVYFIIQRGLSESELTKAEGLFKDHYTPAGAAEYLGKGV